MIYLKHCCTAKHELHLLPGAEWPGESSNNGLWPWTTAGCHTGFYKIVLACSPLFVVSEHRKRMEAFLVTSLSTLTGARGAQWKETPATHEKATPAWNTEGVARHELGIQQKGRNDEKESLKKTLEWKHNMLNKNLCGNPHNRMT